MGNCGGVSAAGGNRARGGELTVGPDLGFTESERPFAGLRVIETASWIAAPAVGRMLRYLGADVIKVEPRGGDGLRGMANPARRPGVNPPFEVTNFGKRSVVLDLGTAEARTAFGTLLETADVLVTNLAPAFL